MDFWRDYWTRIGGPWWVNLIGALATAVTLLLAIVNSRNAWMWVAIALVIVVLVQLLGAYRNHRVRERQRESLPFLLDDQIRKGTELEKELRKPLPRAYNIFTELDPHLQRVDDFYHETYTLLFHSAPAYAADLWSYVGPYFERETERQTRFWPRSKRPPSKRAVSLGSCEANTPGKWCSARTSMPCERSVRS